MDPIAIKMKMADPEQVTALISDAVQSSMWVDEHLPEIGLVEIVRDISSALSKAGCVVIQVDNDDPTLSA